jgi:hypothetical protein
MDDAARLLELNRLTFLAESRPAQQIEGRPWDGFLAGVLADDFLGRRGREGLPHQNREAFLGYTMEASDATRNIVGQPTVWVAGTVGAVACDVRLGDDDHVRFRNIKVFVRREEWQCVYWQVTPFDPAAL